MKNRVARKLKQIPVGYLTIGLDQESPPGQARMMYDGTPPFADDPAICLLF